MRHERPIKAPKHGKEKYVDGPRADVALWLGHSWLSDCARMNKAELDKLVLWFAEGNPLSLGEAVFLHSRRHMSDDDFLAAVKAAGDHQIDEVLRLYEDMRTFTVPETTRALMRQTYLAEVLI